MRYRGPIPIFYILVFIQVFNLESCSGKCNCFTSFLINLYSFNHSTKFCIIKDTPRLRITAIFRNSYCKIRNFIVIIRDLSFTHNIRSIRKLIRYRLSIFISHKDFCCLSLCIFSNRSFFPTSVCIYILFGFNGKFDTGQLISFTGTIV